MKEILASAIGTMSLAVFGLIVFFMFSIPADALTLTPDTDSGFNVPFFLKGLLEGEDAPEFSARDLEGNTIDSRDFEGQSVQLRFWSPTCSYCIDELPMVQAEYDHLDDSVIFLTVVSNIDAETMQAFVEEHDITYPVLLDTDASLRDTFEVNVTPYTYHIGADGKIAASLAGAQPTTLENTTCDTTQSDSGTGCSVD